MDYRRETHIRVREQRIHIVVRTIGLMHSKIFVDCYEPLYKDMPDADGNHPFFQTMVQAIEEPYYVTLGLPAGQEYICYTPHANIDDLVKRARENHKMVVAHTREFYSTHWYSVRKFKRRRGSVAS